MDYFLDESGNTGDLINKKNDMGFSNQPIFTHSCIGVDSNKIEDLKSFITDLKKRHKIEDLVELKSQDYYIKNPQLIYEIVAYIVDKKLPIICEVMDKKYNIAISIVNHLIIPGTPNESNGEAQYIRNILTDFITLNAPDICYSTFSNLCKAPSEDKLILCMNSLKEFLIQNKNLINDEGNTILMIDETLDDYNILKRELSESEAIKRFVPIPDLDSNGNIIKLLPNVHSFYNQLARLNKKHNKKLSKITLIHDTSTEFAETLRFCIENIKAMNTDNVPYIPTCDYKVIETPRLIFKDSKDEIAIQVADILAGFLNRFIYGLLYKNLNMDKIYNKTFAKIICINRSSNPYGTNFVLPASKRKILFEQFKV